MNLLLPNRCVECVGGKRLMCDSFYLSSTDEAIDAAQTILGAYDTERLQQDELLRELHTTDFGARLHLMRTIGCGLTNQEIEVNYQSLLDGTGTEK